MGNAGNFDQTGVSSDGEKLENSEVGISGVGYIWSNSDGGNEEEWRYSIAPITAGKIMEYCNEAYDDHDASDHDLSIPPSGELAHDSESTGFDDGDGEDYRDSYSKFEKEVEETFQRALGGVHEDNLVLEINALRLSYDKSHLDCAGAVFYSVMRSALAAAQSSNSNLIRTANEVIDKWKGFLGKYMKSEDEQVKFLKSLGTLLETPAEIRTASESGNAETLNQGGVPPVCSWLPGLSGKTLFTEGQQVAEVSENGSSISKGHQTSVQHESLVKHDSGLDCLIGGVTSKTSWQESKESHAPSFCSKCEPFPTPLKLTEEVQTPATTFPADQEVDPYEAFNAFFGESSGLFGADIDPGGIRFSTKDNRRQDLDIQKIVEVFLCVIFQSSQDGEVHSRRAPQDKLDPLDHATHSFAGILRI